MDMMRQFVSSRSGKRDTPTMSSPSAKRSLLRKQASETAITQA